MYLMAELNPGKTEIKDRLKAVRSVVPSNGVSYFLMNSNIAKNIIRKGGRKKGKDVYCNPVPPQIFLFIFKGRYLNIIRN